MSNQLEILAYKETYAPFFESINTQWINEMFVLEPIDKAVLSQPQEHIINKGGKIWFARHSELGIVGTCALLNKGNGAYELTKMGVEKSARGLKVGEYLLQEVLNEIKQNRSIIGIKTLFLLTNKKCEAAIHLYEKNGFVHCGNVMQEYGTSYERCDVAMKYALNAQGISIS